MNYMLRMDILNPVYNSIHEGLDLCSQESTSNADQLVQALILAYLQKDIDVVFVLEVVMELYHVLVMQGFVDTDLVE
jgi:hypothetical protein